MGDIVFVYAVAAASVLLILLFCLWRRPQALIHGPPRESLIAGNLAQLFSPGGIEYHEKFTKEYGNAFELYGLLGEKQFFISDAHAIAAVLNSPDTFHETKAERRAFRSIARLIFGSSLFAATGLDHKKLRRTLNPVFATRHIRDLLPLFHSIAHQLKNGLAADIRSRASISYHLPEPELKEGGREKVPSAEVDVLDWVMRTALDLIGLGGLGYDFGALKGTHDPYSETARHLLPTVSEVSIITPFLHVFMKLGPASFRRFMVGILPVPAIQRFKKVVDVMDETANHVYWRKKEEVSRLLKEQGNTEELKELKDVMSLTLASNVQNPRLADEELVAQMSTLIFAALDTTSGAIVRTLQLLSTRPAIQERLRNELTEAKLMKRGDDLDFETLDGLPYLDAVCAEVLRLHPPVPFMSRTSQTPFVLPLSTPVPSSQAKDATDLNALPLPAGTTVYLSIQGVNRDPNIWGPDADEFRPDRWLVDSKADTVPDYRGKESDRERLRSAKKEVPSLWSSVLSFSAGPRGCIGFKFGLVEMKVVLSALLPSFRFQPSSTEIEWHLSLTQAPHVDMKGTKVPGLPLVVEVIED